MTYGLLQSSHPICLSFGPITVEKRRTPCVSLLFDLIPLLSILTSDLCQGSINRYTRTHILDLIYLTARLFAKPVVHNYTGIGRTLPNAKYPQRKCQ